MATFRDFRKPDASIRQKMLDSFKGLRLPEVDEVILRSSESDLRMGVLRGDAVPLRDGLRPEQPPQNRAELLKKLGR